MGGVLWGCLSALCLGSADFMARFGTRALGARSVYLVVLAIGGTVLTVVVLASGTPIVRSPPGLALSALHGLSVVVMSVLLYTALARGPVSMVAPIVAAHPVLVLAFAFATGQRPSLAQWLAMAAIVAGVRGGGPLRSRWSERSGCEPGRVEEGHRASGRGASWGRACERRRFPVIPRSLSPQRAGSGNPRESKGQRESLSSEDPAARRTTLAIAVGCECRPCPDHHQRTGRRAVHGGAADHLDRAPHRSRGPARSVRGASRTAALRKGAGFPSSSCLVCWTRAGTSHSLPGAPGLIPRRPRSPRPPSGW